MHYQIKVSNEGLEDDTHTHLIPFLPDWNATSLNSIQRSLKWKRHLMALAVRSPRGTVTKRALWLTRSTVGLKVTGSDSQSDPDRK